MTIQQAMVAHAAIMGTLSKDVLEGIELRVQTLCFKPYEDFTYIAAYEESMHGAMSSTKTLNLLNGLRAIGATCYMDYDNDRKSVIVKIVGF